MFDPSVRTSPSGASITSVDNFVQAEDEHAALFLSSSTAV